MSDHPEQYPLFDSPEQRASIHSKASVGTLMMSLPFVTILLGHVAVDTYSFLIPASLGIVEQTFELTPVLAAWLLGAGSLSSGLAQPVFATLSDWSNRRIFGGIGILVAAIFICCIGFAPSIPSLFLIYICGMVGVGMFHPIAASTIGQIAKSNRSIAISMFFVAGMCGGMIGSVFGSRIIASFGLTSLVWMIAPGIVLAYLLNRLIANIDHRPKLGTDAANLVGRKRERWASIGMLYFAASIRFMVNMALVYLYVRLVEGRLSGQFPEMDPKTIAKMAAPIVGSLNGFMIAGMATGGLMAGTLIKPGKEKWPLVLAPLLFAPAIALIPYFPNAIGSFLAFQAGIGFSSMVPVSLAVAQRMLPERTSLASGLLLGGAWAIALVGPRFAEYVESYHGINHAFLVSSALLFVSGILVLPLRSKLLKASTGWS